MAPAILTLILSEVIYILLLSEGLASQAMFNYLKLNMNEQIWVWRLTTALHTLQGLLDGYQRGKTSECGRAQEPWGTPDALNPAALPTLQPPCVNEWGCLCESPYKLPWDPCQPYYSKWGEQYKQDSNNSFYILTSFCAESCEVPSGKDERQ